MAAAAFIIIILVFGVLGLYVSSPANADVHTTVLNYDYFCTESNCSLSNWNYSVPFAYTFDQGEMVTGSEPFSWSSSYSCSITIESVYAVTPGFVFNWSPLPLIVQPGQNATITYGLTAPNHAYSGPLNVDVSLAYC